MYACMTCISLPINEAVDDEDADDAADDDDDDDDEERNKSKPLKSQCHERISVLPIISAYIITPAQTDVMIKSITICIRPYRFQHTSQIPRSLEARGKPVDDVSDDDDDDDEKREEE